MITQEFKEGQRVYAFDIDGSKCYGTLHKNTEYQNISEWYIAYDDGHECAVLDIGTVCPVPEMGKEGFVELIKN